MFAQSTSCGLVGIDGFMVCVEADISEGMPAFDIVGLPDAAIKESKERVRAAMRNCGKDFPMEKVTINLAPADVKKEGPSFDLPIAMAILKASMQLPQKTDISEYVFVGELSLMGEVRPVHGVLPLTIAARDNGYKKIVVPSKNASEAAVVQDIEVYPASHLKEILAHISDKKPIPQFKVDLEELFASPTRYGANFSDVQGQQNVKRAMEVAVAGGHNLLLIGPPGAGKTMLATRLPSIMPNLTFEESIEVTKIHSILGMLRDDEALIRFRPFRAPHHTISASGIAGGGLFPKPGEISLAHNGVLFLDELPEFHKDALEVMRQPLEDGKVSITRSQATLTYPCRTMLVASMNPCKCGYYGDSVRKCTCNKRDIKNYLGRISGPMLDRIDIQVEVSSVTYGELSSDVQSESSVDVKKRIDDARLVQQERYKKKGFHSNAELTPSLIRFYCGLGVEEDKILKGAFERLGMSARAHNRILKVARTIADLAGSESILVPHLAEAIQYRSLDRKYWS